MRSASLSARDMVEVAAPRLLVCRVVLLLLVVAFVVLVVLVVLVKHKKDLKRQGFMWFNGRLFKK